MPMAHRRAVFVWVLLPLALACTSSLEGGRRGILGESRQPDPPVLVESPPAEISAPSSLRAISGELRAVPLQWDPVLAGDVAGYVVERTLADQNAFQRIAIVPDRFVTAFSDQGRDLASKQGTQGGAGDLGDGHAYQYRVRSFDGGGRLSSAATPEAEATTAAAPSQPDTLTVYSNLPRKVALSWSPVMDPTVSGYVVYRSPTARVGSRKFLARLEGRFETAYVDPGLGALRVFYYWVAAVNAAGGEGEATPPARAVTKPEPLPPAGLSVRYQRLGANTLEWEPNVERDIAGYRLLRRRGEDDAEEEVATLGAEQIQAEDSLVGAGERVFYRATAFDADGLESAASDWIEVEGVGYGLRAEARGGSVQLSWDPAVQAQLAETRVLLENSVRSQELGRVSADRFVHEDAKPGKQYSYRIEGVRKDGSPAPPSRLVEVEVPD